MKYSVLENVSWFGHISWYAISGYTGLVLLTYLLQTYVIYPWLGLLDAQPFYKVFGNMCSLGWFCVSFACLPWHDWEDRGSPLRYFLWWLGMLLFGFVYRLMDQKGGDVFAFSLVSISNGSASTEERWVFALTLVLILSVVVYWLWKSADTHGARKRRVVFVRLLWTVGLLFFVSYLVCSGDCEYHLHHWWFGFCLVLLSTPLLTSNVDYVLQGVFWGLIIDAFVVYEVQFHKFYN